MSIPADLQLVITVLLVPLVGWLWREGHARLKAAEERQRAAERELADFKLVVAREYASLGALAQAESRLLDAVAEIKKSLDDIHRELRKGRLGAAE